MPADELIIDRGRMSYRDTKRAAILRMKLQKAERDLDVEAVEAAFDELGAMVEKSIVSVPADYFVEEAPAEALKLEPGWIDWISQEAFQALQDATAEAANPGEVKG